MADEEHAMAEYLPLSHMNTTQLFTAAGWRFGPLSAEDAPEMCTIDACMRAIGEAGSNFSGDICYGLPLLSHSHRVEQCNGVPSFGEGRRHPPVLRRHHSHVEADSAGNNGEIRRSGARFRIHTLHRVRPASPVGSALATPRAVPPPSRDDRSEERRVGKEC